MDVERDAGDCPHDRVEAFHKNILTEGSCVSLCVGESEKLIFKNLPKKRKTGPSVEVDDMTPEKRKKSSTPLAGRNRKPEKIKININHKNLITNHFIPLSTAKDEGGVARGHRVEPLGAVGGGTGAVPRAHAVVGTSQLLGEESVQFVTNKLIGCNKSAAGKLANTGERNISCWGEDFTGENSA